MKLLKILMEELVTGPIEWVDFENNHDCKASCRGWNEIEDVCDCGETNVSWVQTDFGTKQAKGEL